MNKDLDVRDENSRYSRKKHLHDNSECTAHSWVIDSRSTRFPLSKINFKNSYRYFEHVITMIYNIKS